MFTPDQIPQLIQTVIVSLIGWLLLRNIKHMDQKLDSMQVKIDSLQDENKDLAVRMGKQEIRTDHVEREIEELKRAARD